MTAGRAGPNVVIRTVSERCLFCGHAVGADERCESCGAVREAREEKRVRGRCPRCHEVRLFPFALGSVALQSCGRCKGSFLSSGDWDALLEVFTREPLPEVVIADIATHRDDTVDRSPYRRAAPPPSEDSRPPDLAEDVRCPTCDEPMERLEFAGISGIVVDVCKLHGLWLDGGELERIVALVHKREEPASYVPRPVAQREEPPRVEPIDPSAMDSLVASLRESERVMASEDRDAPPAPEREEEEEEPAPALSALQRFLRWLLRR